MLLAPYILEHTLSFFDFDREACKVKLKLQLLSKAMWERAKQLPCHKWKTRRKLFAMSPEQRNLCSRWDLYPEVEWRPESFPNGLIELRMHRWPLEGYPRLPDGLIDFNVVENTGEELPITPGVFPETLRKLNIGIRRPLPIGIFPEKLRRLNLLNYSVEAPVGLFPSSLQILRMPHYNAPLRVGVLPPRLKEFVAPRLDQPLEVGVFPQTLDTLIMRNRLDYPPGLVPPNVSYVRLAGFDSPTSSSGDFLLQLDREDEASVALCTCHGAGECVACLFHLGVLGPMPPEHASSRNSSTSSSTWT